ncbi:hypothetical protein NHX12_020184 [Muraenolepis orangiensis]|uniref:Uncharacterized protein n=1 Tax=Muraenolepis orangiensis TaxID=630683 RepID=A0A9Q0I0E8_9TELE|nr:hypothetical protein NHX12_020184 [Muraenolepis orangiensis]
MDVFILSAFTVVYQCISMCSYVVPSCPVRLPARRVSVLQMSRSASTFSLSDAAKNGAFVRRSNSLDHPPIRPRVSVCIRSPAPIAAHPAPGASARPGPEAAPGASARPGPEAAAAAEALTGGQSFGLPSGRVSLLHKPGPQAPWPQSHSRFPGTLPSQTFAPWGRISTDLRAPNTLHLIPPAQQAARQAPPATYRPRASVLIPHQAAPGGQVGRAEVPADPRKTGPTSPRRETLL